MSHSVTLWCGCRVYVACHPATGASHARILETRGPGCGDRRHWRGARLGLWELLPDPRQPDPALEFAAHSA